MSGGQAQRPQGGFDRNQGQGRQDRGGNNGQRFDRGPRGDSFDKLRTGSSSSAPKVSLWQKLKSSLGLGGGKGDLGGKW